MINFKNFQDVTGFKNVKKFFLYFALFTLFGYYIDEKILARIEKFRKRFEAADENKDGKLSSDEYVAFQYLDLFPRMHDVFVEELLVPLDLDKDGGISFEEFKKGFSGIHTFYELMNREKLTTNDSIEAIFFVSRIFD